MSRFATFEKDELSVIHHALRTLARILDGELEEPQEEAVADKLVEQAAAATRLADEAWAERLKP